MQLTLAEEVIQKYERLIYKVLSDNRIFLLNPSYQDWEQELKLVLVQLVDSFTSMEQFEQEYPLSYLYRKLKWSLVDLRRKEQKQGHELLQPEEWAAVLAKDVLIQEDAKLLIEEFYYTLVSKDQEKLQALLGGNELSRQMRGYYRKSLRKKFQEFIKYF